MEHHKATTALNGSHFKDKNDLWKTYDEITHEITASKIIALTNSMD